MRAQRPHIHTTNAKGHSAMDFRTLLEGRGWRHAACDSEHHPAAGFVGGTIMVMKLGLREGAVSVGIFGTVMAGLMSFDPRVRETMSDMFGSGAMSPFGDRLGDLGGALWMAARHQSLENAPLLVFATVGAVLTVFMLRS
jgi:hypothetical protein